MDTLAQQIINGYEFVEPIGSGGFGVVYRAVQPALGREVAIKVILPAHAQQPDFIQRFEQEARLIARLEHPHIVPLYDYWQDANGAFLVMRWLPETLRSRIQTGALPLNVVADLLDQIASALQVAHRSGVIHRDIKPDNLLLDGAGNAYLADFGIAKVTNAGSITSAGQIIGSMAYIAPEQISGAGLTPQADIYSLGLVVYELLTGVPAYNGASASELLNHHLNSPIPSIRAQQPELPSTLDAVIAMATAKQVTDRYSDAIRFAQAFRAALPAAKHLQPLVDPLTERELEILQLMAEGLTNSEIAEHLYVTPATIKWYKKQIYSKLDVHSHELAIAHARALKLIAPDRSAQPDHPAQLLPIAQSVATSVLPPVKLRLPTQTTPFIGREVEVSALISLLRDPRNRLLTILAPGGMGKTRLVLEVAARLADEFRDGATLVALSAVSAPDQVISAVANAVGVILSGQLDPKAQLLEHFRQQQTLLICDNFEHLLEAAPLLLDILQAAPEVKILTTSREQLNLSAEVVFSLGGLDTPNAHAPADPLNYSAVRLFVGGAAARARAAEYTRADLDQIGCIGRLVQGMPLAILLAASWTDLLSVSEIADEVSRGIDLLESQWRDTPERQRSIRAVFDASWQRLTRNEAEALMKLSVFRGGFTRRAAEEVAGASLRTLSGLINKALLWMDTEGRCSIHELLRQYAAEKLSDPGAAEQTRAAHSAYYLQALAAAESDLTGHNQIPTLRNIAADLENVRSAVIFAAAQRDYDRLAAAVHPLWLSFFYQGTYADGDALLSAVADSLRRDPSTAARDRLLGDVLSHQALLLVSMTERVRADLALDEAKPLVEASDDVRMRAFYYAARSYWLAWEDLADRVDYARQSLSFYQSIHDPWGEAYAAMASCAPRLFGANDRSEAVRALVTHSLNLSEAMGNSFGQAYALNSLAFLHDSPHGSPERIAILERVLAIRRAHISPIAVAKALGNLGLQKASAGRLADAARDIEEMLAIKQQQGNARDTLGFDDLGEIYFRQGRLSEARGLFEEALGRIADTEQHAWRNVYRLYLAEVTYAEGDFQQSESLAAEMLSENGQVTDTERRFRLTYIMAVGGLAALAQGDVAAALQWIEHAEQSAQFDPNHNGAAFALILRGQVAFGAGDASTASSLFEEAAAYFQHDYAEDPSMGWERYLALVLALTGSSRAAVRLGDLDRALADCRAVLDQAARLKVDAFALMALIPAAEIAAAQGDLDQAARLAMMAAEHPHIFAVDRAEAVRLLATQPPPPLITLDLWAVVGELIDL